MCPWEVHAEVVRWVALQQVSSGVAESSLWASHPQEGQGPELPPAVDERLHEGDEEVEGDVTQSMRQKMRSQQWTWYGRCLACS